LAISLAVRPRPRRLFFLDICLDLGIVPALMDPATWDELRLAITLYGSDPTPLLAGDIDPMGAPASGESPTIPVAYPPWPAPPDQPLPSWKDRCRETDRRGSGPGP
jgi:hypothetical protein